ncbi:MAG: hypothetical protein L3K18_00405 [Thermoplasmata archaeon]|nr:hypothetical protein [Thermoplasmata archaeon]
MIENERAGYQGAGAVVLAVLIAAGTAGLLGIHASQFPPTCPTLEIGSSSARSPIQHVFFLVKENHAFENYFGDRPGVLGYPPAGSFPVSFGSTQRISPFPLTADNTPDLPHSHDAEIMDLNGGKLDNFVAEASALGASAPNDAVGYYPPAAIAPYGAYADHYALADRFFAGVLGPTLPNRVFDLAATDGNWTGDAPPPGGSFHVTTIIDQLESYGIGWAYDYAGVPQNLAPDLVASIAASPCELHRIVPVGALPDQLNLSHAPAVTFIDPSNDPLVSEHPQGNVTLGVDWSATVVNEIFASPVGSSSAIFLFFDEAGGFWDPVTPPVTGPDGDGFRVPLLVLSPWTPSGTVLDEPLDPAALLKFVDENWGLPFLNPRVAGASELTGAFAFGGPRTPPLFLPSPVPLDAGSASAASDGSPAAHSPPGIGAAGNSGSLYLVAPASAVRWGGSGSRSTTRSRCS